MFDRDRLKDRLPCFGDVRDLVGCGSEDEKGFCGRTDPDPGTPALGHLMGRRRPSDPILFSHTLSLSHTHTPSQVLLTVII